MGRTQIQIMESNHELQKKKKMEEFSKSRGGRGEGRTQILILESNHELPKKKSKSQGRRVRGLNPNSNSRVKS